MTLAIGPGQHTRTQRSLANVVRLEGDLQVVGRKCQVRTLRDQASTALDDIGPQIDEAINQGEKPEPWPSPKPGQKMLPAPKQEIGIPGTSPTRDLTLDAPYSEEGVLRRTQEFPASVPQAKKLAIQPVLDSLEGYKQQGVVDGLKSIPI